MIKKFALSQSEPRMSTPSTVRNIELFSSKFNQPETSKSMVKNAS